ncbi:MAG: response regulator [candidate division Zixibacteria bacterium]|nr:response regulator [candidate division Zixibacteria bacterium]
MSTEVLLVDDEREFLDSLSGRLKAKGYNITAVVNGEEALDNCRRETYDIIIADLCLPGSINGWDIIAAAREKYPRSGSFAITAFPDPRHKSKAESLGTFAYLEKPISLDLIVDLVQNCVHKQRLENELETLRGEKEYFTEHTDIWRLLQDSYNSLPFPAFMVMADNRIILPNLKATVLFDTLKTVNNENDVIMLPEQLKEYIEAARDYTASDNIPTRKVKIGGGSYNLRCWKIESTVIEPTLSVVLEPTEILEESLLSSETIRVWLPILLKMNR